MSKKKPKSSDNICPNCGKGKLQRGYLFVGLDNPGPVRFKSKSGEVVNTNSYACFMCGHIELFLDIKKRQQDYERAILDWLIEEISKMYEEEEIPLKKFKRTPRFLSDSRLAKLKPHDWKKPLRSLLHRTKNRVVFDAFDFTVHKERYHVYSSEVEDDGLTILFEFVGKTGTKPKDLPEQNDLTY